MLRHTIQAILAIIVALTLGCRPGKESCRSDDLVCPNRALPGILWLSTCNFQPVCGNQTLDGLAPSAGTGSSIFADCQRINIAHGDSSSGDLRFSRSNDGGLTWYNTIVDDGADTGYASRIYADKSEVFISYHDAGNADLWFAYSGDQGQTWRKIQVNKVAEDPDSVTGMFVRNPEIWISALVNNSLTIYYSADRGLSWQEYVAIPGPSRGYESSIFVSGNQIFTTDYHLADRDLYFNHSSDGGSTWQSIVLESAGDVGRYSSLILSNGVLLVTYYDVTNTRLRVARSTDLGVNWSLATIDSSASVGTESDLTSDGSALYVAYYDATNTSLKAARSVDDGLTWEVKTLDSGPNAGRYTGISATGPGVFVSHQASGSSLKLSIATPGTGCVFTP